MYTGNLVMFAGSVNPGCKGQHRLIKFNQRARAALGGVLYLTLTTGGNDTHVSPVLQPFEGDLLGSTEHRVPFAPGVVRSSKKAL